MIKRYHWWIATSVDGKPQLIYGAPDFGANGGVDVARAKGLSMLQGVEFKLFRYPTSDVGSASAFHRGKRLESGEGLKASTQRLGHEKSITKRLARRRRLGL